MQDELNGSHHLLPINDIQLLFIFVAKQIGGPSVEISPTNI